MMLTVQIRGLSTLKANFKKAPLTTLKYLSLATQASVFELEKQAVDRNFQFKTPRGKRTGYLALSFGYAKRFDRGGLRGSIGPTAYYSPYVYFGTRRGIKPNPFMERIAKAAMPHVRRHFERAVTLVARDIAAI